MQKLNLKIKYDLDNPPFKECPFCGNHIFYKKENCYANYDFYFSYNKEIEVDNSSMYDYLLTKETGKFVYCSECDKRLFKYRD